MPNGDMMLQDISAQLTAQVAQLQQAIIDKDDTAIAAAADAIETTAQDLANCIKRVEDTAPPSSEAGGDMPPIPPAAPMG